MKFMDNPRPEKVAVVEEVRERLSSADAAILTEYRGLNVADMARLRRSLREAGGQYRIYKNSLVRFAVRELGLDLEEMLLGPTAIAFVDGDAASVAKALRDFSRTNPNLVIKGGVLGTTVLSAVDASALADLPSRDQLLAQLVGAMAAPLQQMAGLLAALPRNFAYGLRALAEQQGGLVDLEAPEPEPEPEPVHIPDHPGVSPAPDETENPPDFEGESPPPEIELPESPAPDETATPPSSESDQQGEQ
jgi:large subunit ribosomal protein L10